MQTYLLDRLSIIAILFIGACFGAIMQLLISVSHAQLAPFYAPLDEQLSGIRAEQYLSLERELERAEHDRSAYRLPCPR